MGLVAKDEDGNDIAPVAGDKFTRLNRGLKHEPFSGVVTAVHDDKIEVSGSGYIGGFHYGKWWGEFLSLDHVTIQKTLKG